MYVLRRSDLNPEQYEAATHLDGPLLVLAGAGSGKTRVITHRIAWMVVQQQIDPASIVAVSFTNKAAEEMRQRVAGLIGSKLASRCTLSTFHALGAEILRRDIRHLGYRTPFAILDIADQRAIIKDILKELRLDGSRVDPDMLLGIISKAKMAFVDPTKLPGMRFNPVRAVIGKVYSRYNDALRALNGVDFDDLIGLPVKLFHEHPDVLAKYHRRWIYLMVDEYQDTNHTQFALLEALAARHKNVVVVGDDDQSIYGFRGADSGHILHFEQHFAGARVIALEQNYRSSKIILEAANAVIAKNTKRREKVLWSDGSEGERIRLFECRDEREEAQFVADQMLNLQCERQLSWRDFAILYRANVQSRTFEEALRERGIPYRIVGGTNFFDRKEVRDVLFYLRAALNPSDDLAVRRIVNVPKRGLGPAITTQLDELARREKIAFFEAMQRAVREPGLVDFASERPREKLGELVATLERYFHRFSSGEERASVLARSLIAEVRYLEHLQSGGGQEVNVRRRVDNVVEVVDALASYEARSERASLSRFLERIALEPSSAQKKGEEEEAPDEVVMMTFHSSKGLEFPVVFMVGCEENLLPHEQSLRERGGIEEERRLCYVGITRAKKLLTITLCKQRMRHGEAEDRTPSRFLADIPEHTLERSTDAASVAAASLKEAQAKRDRRHLDALRAAIFKD